MTCRKQNPSSTPYECMRKGIGLGKNLSVPITMGLSKDVLREIASRLNVRRYSYMTKQQLFQAIQERGVRRFKPFDLMEA